MSNAIMDSYARTMDRRNKQGREFTLVYGDPNNSFSKLTAKVFGRSSLEAGLSITIPPGYVAKELIDPVKKKGKFKSAHPDS